MNYLPIFYHIQQRTCLVIGGGAVAARKVGLLRKAGASVVVVSPQLCDELEQLKSGGRVQHRARDYRPEDLDGCALVIAATDQADINEQA